MSVDARLLAYFAVSTLLIVAAVIFVAVMPRFIEAGDPPARFVAMLAGYEAIMLVWLNLYRTRVGDHRLANDAGFIQQAGGLFKGCMDLLLGFDIGKSVGAAFVH